MTPAARVIASAKEAAMLAAHEAHAERMRAQGAAAAVKERPPSAADFAEMAISIARLHMPPLDLGPYCLTDASTVYARRLLLEAAASLYSGDKAKLLIALLAWEHLGGRQHSYSEADSATLQGIASDLEEAMDGIAWEIEDLQDTIDGTGGD